jgi:Mg/Co/Ni transporter MgtE
MRVAASNHSEKEQRWAEIARRHRTDVIIFLEAVAQADRTGRLEELREYMVDEYLNSLNPEAAENVSIMSNGAFVPRPNQRLLRLKFLDFT